MVGAACTQPAFGGNLQIRLRLPQRTGAWQLVERAERFDHIDHIHEHTEPSTDVGERDHNRILLRSHSEHQANRIGLAADAERMDLETRLGDCAHRRRDLKHVRPHDHLVARGEVIGVVLHERRTTLETIAHHGPDTHEHCRLPVALGRESPAVFGREALRTHARQLRQGAEVLEVVDASRAAIGAHHVHHCAFLTSGDEQRIIVLVQQLGRDLVLRLVVLDEVLDLVLLDRIVRGDELVDGPGVDRGAEYTLRLGLVAFGDGNVAHIVAPAHHVHRVRGLPTGAGARPHADLVGHRGIGVMPHDDLARDAETSDNVAVFTIAVRGLVEIHEIHVNGLPWNLEMVLGVKLQQWLAQRLEPTDPHLRRREGVHPRDHADA